MLKLSVVILAVCAHSAQAAVIRTPDEGIELLKATTISSDNVSTTLEPELLTDKDEYLTTTTTEKFGTLSGDKEATLLDPAPVELIKSGGESVQVKKSANLLLLSTPKITEKPKQPEDNIDDSEEQDEIIEKVTEILMETTTNSTVNEEATTHLINNDIFNEQPIEMTDRYNDPMSDKKLETESILQDLTTTKKITKLYPINDTALEESEISETVTEESRSLIIENQSTASLNSNVDSVILEEPEGDSVLKGSYADINSELHLQPIVQSVEIVPSTLDDSLFINYVQSL